MQSDRECVSTWLTLVSQYTSIFIASAPDDYESSLGVRYQWGDDAERLPRRRVVSLRLPFPWVWDGSSILQASHIPQGDTQCWLWMLHKLLSWAGSLAQW